MRYVLPVLWMSSRFHIIERIGRIRDEAYVSSSSPDGGTGAKSAVAECILFVSVQRTTVASNNIGTNELAGYSFNYQVLTRGRTDHFSEILIWYRGL